MVYLQQLLWRLLLILTETKADHRSFVATAYRAGIAA